MSSSVTSGQNPIVYVGHTELEVFMRKYFFPTILFLHFNCLASDFYEGYIQTDTRRFPISVSKGLMSSSEVMSHFAKKKKILYFESPGIGTSIIDQSNPGDPIIYSAISVDGRRLLVGTRSSDLQKLFEEKPSTLTYHFNHQTMSVVLEGKQSLY